MTQIIVVTIALALLIAALVYYSNAHLIVKLVMLPMTLVIALLGYNYFIDQLGRPIYGIPVGEFTYVIHVEVGNQVELIAADNVSSRLYIFEATEEQREQLKGAQQSAEQGIEQQGEFQTDESPESNGELEFWTKEDNPK